MGNDQKKYNDCIRKKTQEYLKSLGKKTFTLDDLASATKWATEQCKDIEPACSM